jgi:potassium-transporting ATPase potassium-binding subunit
MASGILQIVVFLAVLLALVKPLGAYMARVYDGEPTFLDRTCHPVERFFYRACGIHLDSELGRGSRFTLELPRA